MNNRFIPNDITFSLEVFPPKTAKGVGKLMEVLDQYVSLSPAAITVTFGATGTVGDFASVCEVVSHIQNRTDIPVAAHMTCAGRSRSEVNDYVSMLARQGVKHIVALRGDMMAHGPAYQPHPDGYPMTYDFVAGIKAAYPEICVYVAGYPEVHPESPSETADLDHLKRKVDAGADAVLTQFFFDPEVFLRWRDKVEKRGIHVPIIPGLLPIISFPKMCEIAARCKTNVPSFLHDMFEGVDPEGLDHKLLAMNVLSHQITRLIEHGVSHFHFYTMNETILTRHLCKWMRAGF